MMRLMLHVDYLDGSGADIDATAPDLLEFERKFDRSFVSIGDQTRLEWILYLCWYNQRRKEKTALDFEPWTETVSSVQFRDSEAAPVPLESNPRTGS
jgi:hypothetical protein